MSENTEIKGIKLIDLGTLARKYRVKVSWLREQLRSRVPPQKQIPRVKIGRQVRFIEEDVDQWVRNGCRNQDAAIACLPHPHRQKLTRMRRRGKVNGEAAPV
jgi:predicted DNA-binding transcriptional regulator AlpA